MVHFKPVRAIEVLLYVMAFTRTTVKACHFRTVFMFLADQGPVVQSIVGLTSLLRGQLVKCFMTL